MVLTKWVYNMRINNIVNNTKHNYIFIIFENGMGKGLTLPKVGIGNGITNK